MQLFEIVLEATFQGQTLINRWNYQTNAVPAAVTPSFALVSAFGGIQDAITNAFPAGSIMATIQLLQHGSVFYTQIVAKNIYTLADFYATPFKAGTIGGIPGGVPTSPTLALGMKSTQVTRAIRSGHKRIGGLEQGSVGSAGNVAPSVLTTLQTLSDLMSNPISYDDEGVTVSFIPLIVGKKKDHPAGKTTWAYYYWPESEWQEHIAVQPKWSPMPQVRTQTSRQYGKGK